MAVHSRRQWTRRHRNGPLSLNRTPFQLRGCTRLATDRQCEGSSDWALEARRGTQGSVVQILFTSGRYNVTVRAADHRIQSVHRMTMTPGIRRFALTAHITSSVGWIGAALVFLAVALVALTSQDDLTVRGAYLLMERAGWLVLVPLALASLVTGLVMSLGTTWGLFRHYWVVAKLLITVFSTIILLVYTKTFAEMARVAADLTVTLDRVRNPSPVVHAFLALVLLSVATVLGVYKPVGLTAYGRRRQRQAREALSPTGSPSARRGLDSVTSSSPRWLYLMAIAIIAVMVAMVILHLTGISLRHH